MHPLSLPLVDRKFSGWMDGSIDRIGSKPMEKEDGQPLHTHHHGEQPNTLTQKQKKKIPVFKFETDIIQ